MNGGDIIDERIAAPIWRQLHAILRRRILAGHYEPGHAIPSEKQCEQEWGVARGTCRKAVALLRDEGLVETLPGKGSFVTGVPAAPEDAWRESVEKRVDALEAEVAELRAVATGARNG